MAYRIEKDPLGDNAIVAAAADGLAGQHREQFAGSGRP